MTQFQYSIPAPEGSVFAPDALASNIDQPVTVHLHGGGTIPAWVRRCEVADDGSCVAVTLQAPCAVVPGSVAGLGPASSDRWLQSALAGSTIKGSLSFGGRTMDAVEAQAFVDEPVSLAREARLNEVAETIARVHHDKTTNGEAAADEYWRDVWNYAYTDSVRARYRAMAEAAWAIFERGLPASKVDLGSEES